jgi:hypothetical protein
MITLVMVELVIIVMPYVLEISSNLSVSYQKHKIDQQTN